MFLDDSLVLECNTCQCLGEREGQRHGEKGFFCHSNLCRDGESG